MSVLDSSIIANWTELAESGDFEATYAALEQSVALLETGGLSLSLMTECYEVGLRLSKRCNDLLRSAELRVSVLEQSLIDIDESPASSLAFEE
ncbi:MAG: exodeoxyribonuclease VII small subunit [Thermomicrobiales bacterium]